jgi:hypothetical protein
VEADSYPDEIFTEHAEAVAQVIRKRRSNRGGKIFLSHFDFLHPIHDERPDVLARVEKRLPVKLPAT